MEKDKHQKNTGEVTGMKQEGLLIKIIQVNMIFGKILLCERRDQLIYVHECWLIREQPYLLDMGLLGKRDPFQLLALQG